jgi:protein-disulfide isomerase
MKQHPVLHFHLWPRLTLGLLLLLLTIPSEAADDIVATFDGQRISSADLEAKTGAKVEAKRAEYEANVRRLRLNFERERQDFEERMLGSMVDEGVLASEAKARKTTPEQLLAALKSAPVTEADVKTFYEEKKAQITQPFEVVAPQIKDYLQKAAFESARREYLDGLRAKYHAKVLLSPRRDDVQATGPERGPRAAPVTLIEFSDFQCPFCGRMEPTLQRVLAKYPTQVRLIYRNYPLADIHPNAEKAAEAALCALEQGKFWEMHDLMFADQGALDVAGLKAKARRIGLRAEVFDSCLDTGKEATAVSNDKAAGEALGIVGTPATFVNGRYLSGEISEKDLVALIEDELRRSGATAGR